MGRGRRGAPRRSVRRGGAELARRPATIPHRPSDAPVLAAGAAAHRICEEAMLILEVETELPASEVVSRAKQFFTGRLSPATGFVQDESDSHVRFHTEAGVLTIGVAKRDGRMVVRGSTSRLHQALSQFLSTVTRPEHVRQNLGGPHPAPPKLPA
jgi:hypothetical protein